MPLAEGVSARIAYKFYTDQKIIPGVPAISATDPGPTDAQILRRVASTLAFTKETYQSNEIRSDYQIADFRHGVRRVAGNVSGELSPLTYADWFAASLRADWVPAVALSEAELTSMAADGTASTLTFAGGDPVTSGLRAGMGVQFTGLATTANNNKTFMITGFSGTSNRTVAVLPAPATHAAETTFAMSSTGSSISIPTTGHVRRKVAVEIYNEDVDIARLYTECRVGGFNVAMPASGMTTIEFNLTGRDMELYEDAAAPFFTDPNPNTSTGLLASVNGLLRIGGDTVAVVTAMNIQNAITLTADAVVGANISPEIFAGRNVVTGQMTAFFENADLLNDFKNESEIDILAYLPTKSDPGSPAMSFYLPRVKLGGADPATTGEIGQMITIPFQALKYEGTTAGVENATIQIWDSEVVTGGGLMREQSDEDPASPRGYAGHSPSAAKPEALRPSPAAEGEHRLAKAG